MHRNSSLKPLAVHNLENPSMLNHRLSSMPVGNGKSWLELSQLAKRFHNVGNRPSVGFSPDENKLAMAIRKTFSKEPFSFMNS